MSDDKLYYGDKVCDPNWDKDKLKTFKIVFPINEEHCGFKPCDVDCWDKVMKGEINRPLDIKGKEKE